MKVLRAGGWDGIEVECYCGAKLLVEWDDVHYRYHGTASHPCGYFYTCPECSRQHSINLTEFHLPQCVKDSAKKLRKVSDCNPAMSSES